MQFSGVGQAVAPSVGGARNNEFSGVKAIEGIDIQQERRT